MKYPLKHYFLFRQMRNLLSKKVHIGKMNPRIHLQQKQKLIRFVAIQYLDSVYLK